MALRVHRQLMHYPATISAAFYQAAHMCGTAARKVTPAAIHGLQPEKAQAQTRAAIRPVHRLTKGATNRMKTKARQLAAIIMVSIFGTQSCAQELKSASPEKDALLAKFAHWHLGFTTNAKQRDADLAEKVSPRWGLSELRFQRIWPQRSDGYWLYYETSQPDVRPDRNQIWHLYRDAQGALRIDSYNFKDIDAGLTYWGKGANAKAFDRVDMADLVSTPGCNAAYVWREDFERFIGVNPHEECKTIGASYLLQHVEISRLKDGTLVRKDWHTFYDGDGISKRGQKFKSER